MNDIEIMIDLETLGNVSDPVIIQVSAVAFDRKGNIIDTFNKLVNPQSQPDLSINADTIKWWLSQDSKVINNVFAGSILNGDDLKWTLNTFNMFIDNLRLDYDNVNFWGNGLMSDGLWLKSAYESCQLTIPFKYYEYRDVRTLTDIGHHVLGVDYKKETPFEGNAHDAIDDCHHQIKYCLKIINELDKLNGN